MKILWIAKFHDKFTYYTGMLNVLNVLKKLLTDKHGVEFPMFEKGCLSYYQKRGDEAGATAATKILKGSKTLKRTRQHLSSLLNKTFDASTVNNFINKFFDEGVELLETVSGGIPILKVAQLTVDVIDKYVI